MPDFDLAALFAQIPWLTLAFAAAIAVAAILLMTPFARRTGWVDKPTARKAHEGEIPLIGGWAVLTSMSLLLSLCPLPRVAPLGYWVGALLLFVVALIDDRHPIRARYRFMVQFAAALAGVSMGGQMLPDVGDLLGVGEITLWWIAVPVTVLGNVEVINAINFSNGTHALGLRLCIVTVF